MLSSLYYEQVAFACLLVCLHTPFSFGRDATNWAAWVSCCEGWSLAQRVLLGLHLLPKCMRRQLQQWKPSPHAACCSVLFSVLEPLSDALVETAADMREVRTHRSS